VSRVHGHGAPLVEHLHVTLSEPDWIRWRCTLSITKETPSFALRRMLGDWIECQLFENGCRGPRRVLTFGRYKQVHGLTTAYQKAALCAVAQAAGISNAHALRMAIRMGCAQTLGPWQGYYGELERRTGEISE